VKKLICQRWVASILNHSGLSTHLKLTTIDTGKSSLLADQLDYSWYWLFGEGIDRKD